MEAALFALALFVYWTFVGLAFISLLKLDARDLRVAATTPMLGSAISVIPLFVASNLGVPLQTGARPILSVLLAAALAVLAFRRPAMSWTFAPLVGVSVVELAILGSPFLTFGFDWIANANGDMAFYVLAASHLLGHGLVSPVDFHAMARGHDFTSSAQALEVRGLRPGTQIEIAAVAAATRQLPVSVYMPVSLAVAMGSVCGVGALVMQATRRWWAAVIGGLLLVASPLAGYGVLEQLLPQQWGVGLAVALFAWIMRRGLYEQEVSLREVVPISLLAAGLFLVAYEVASSLVVGYLVYLIFLGTQRALHWRPLIRVWVASIVIGLLIVNTFTPRAVSYLIHYVLKVGTSTGASSLLRQLDFGYAVVPTAIPGFIGVSSLFASAGSRRTDFAIVVGMVALVLLACAMISGIRRGAGAGAVLLGGAVLAAMLAATHNEFGLFKLYMYLQPFVAATVAVWLANRRSRWALIGGLCVVSALVAVQVPTLLKYIDRSRDPVDLRHASSQNLLPTYRRIIDSASTPVVNVGDNYVLQTLEGSTISRETVHLVGRNVFKQQWATQRFPLGSQHGPKYLTFDEDQAASRALDVGRCIIVFPSGSQAPLNRLELPEGSPDLVSLPCTTKRPLFAFVGSSLGEPATLPDDPRLVSLWELETDPSVPGHTFAGAGRYALLELLGKHRDWVRVQLTVTVSPIGRAFRSFRLPPAAVIGVGRVRLQLVGDGSARVVSPPIRPRTIDGRQYVVLDMGRRGRFPSVPRTTLSGLWGRSVSLDPRALTAYVRDVSLVTDPRRGDRLTPSAVTNESLLDDPHVQYSGIYEDGWLGPDSYAVLRSRRSDHLLLKAEVLPWARHVRVLVDGKTVYAGSVTPGEMHLDVGTDMRVGMHRVRVEWDATKPLSSRDPRRAAARLVYLGFTSPG